MFKCLISFWDGSDGRYYEENKMYEIDLAHHAKIGTLKRFEGASETFKPVTKKRGSKNEFNL